MPKPEKTEENKKVKSVYETPANSELNLKKAVCEDGVGDQKMGLNTTSTGERPVSNVNTDKSENSAKANQNSGSSAQLPVYKCVVIRNDRGVYKGELSVSKTSTPELKAPKSTNLKLSSLKEGCSMEEKEGQEMEKAQSQKVKNNVQTTAEANGSKGKNKEGSPSKEANCRECDYNVDGPWSAVLSQPVERIDETHLIAFPKELVEADKASDGLAGKKQENSKKRKPTKHSCLTKKTSATEKEGDSGSYLSIENYEPRYRKVPEPSQEKGAEEGKRTPTPDTSTIASSSWERMLREVPRTVKRECRTIHYIIRAINFFIRKFSSTSSRIEDVESVSTRYYSAYAYRFYYFIDSLRFERLDRKFIYNDLLKGKSGSLIFWSSDFCYAIKVVRPCEFEVILRHIDRFVSYASENDRTFIVKYLGIFKICLGAKTVHFVMMENVFNGLYAHVYDLKGQQVVRTNTSGVFTEAHWGTTKLLVYNKQATVDQLSRDSMFLASLNLMDYSLIIARVPVETHSDFRMYEGRRPVPHFKLALPKTTHAIGVVDTLTEYNTRKWLESLWHALCCRPNMSSTDPSKYQARFMDLVRHKLFHSLENDEHKKQVSNPCNKAIRGGFAYSQDNLFESGEDLR